MDITPIKTKRDSRRTLKEIEGLGILAGSLIKIDEGRAA